MRHQKKRHRLGRTSAHRKATLAALGTALIQHKRITTTEPKAKALRGFIEPLITRAKEDTTHNRRQVFRRLQDNSAVSELFTEVSAQVGDRPGGYTRVVKLGRRAGDGAPLAVIELVDYNDVAPEEGTSRRSRTRRGGGRGRRSRSKGAATQQAAATATSTQTAKQVETASKDVETETVETPVSEEQTQSVVDRTGDEAPEGQVDDAKAAVEEQKAEAETQDAGESTTANETPATDTAEADVAGDDEAKAESSAAGSDEEAPSSESESESGTEDEDKK